MSDPTPVPAHWAWRDGLLIPGEAAIVDIDGVLADASHRQHYLDGEVRDWEGFFAAAANDGVLDNHAEMVHSLDRGLQIVLLTARPHRLKGLTLEWLHSHDLRWDLLALRGPDEDHSHSVQFKRRAVGVLRALGFDLAFALEDDPRIVEMYATEALPCVYVHSGYYG